VAELSSVKVTVKLTPAVYQWLEKQVPPGQTAARAVERLIVERMMGRR